MTGRDVNVRWPKSSEAPVPMDLFGVDHWSTLAYVETRIVDHHGVLDHDHMRCHTNRHPTMASAKRKVSTGSADASQYPTRIKASAFPNNDGRYGVAELPDHDDYDCLDDLRAAGLIEVAMPVVGTGGYYVTVYGKPITMFGDGDDDSSGLIYPQFVTGLDEQILAVHATWYLTVKGRRVAAALREWRAAGHNRYNFAPTEEATPLPGPVRGERGMMAYPPIPSAEATEALRALRAIVQCVQVGANLGRSARPGAAYGRDLMVEAFDVLDQAMTAGHVPDGWADARVAVLRTACLLPEQSPDGCAAWVRLDRDDPEDAPTVLAVAVADILRILT